MKIKEFIEKVNQNDRMEAEEIDGDGVIAICDDSDHEVIDIPCGATNLLEINFTESYYHYNFGKPSREYLSALIEEFLHTPVKDRFPDKKYCLVAHPDALEQFGTEDCKYVSCVRDGFDGFVFIYGAPTAFTEGELDGIKRMHPFLAPTIDGMKKEVKDDD